MWGKASGVAWRPSDGYSLLLNAAIGDLAGGCSLWKWPSGPKSGERRGGAWGWVVGGARSGGLDGSTGSPQGWPRSDRRRSGGGGDEAILRQAQDTAEGGHKRSVRSDGAGGRGGEAGVRSDRSWCRSGDGEAERACRMQEARSRRQDSSYVPGVRSLQQRAKSKPVERRHERRECCPPSSAPVATWPPQGVELEPFGAKP